MKIIKITLCAIVAAAVIFGIISCVNVNARFPQPESIQRSIGEPIIIDEVSITVDNAQVFRFFDFIKEFNYEKQSVMQGIAEQYDIQICIINITLKNTADHAVPVPFIPYSVIECGAYSNGCDAELLEDLNSVENLIDDLSPGEERTIILPFSIYANLLPGYKNDLINLSSYELVFSTYPIKRVVKLSR